MRYIKILTIPIIASLLQSCQPPAPPPQISESPMDCSNQSVRLISTSNEAIEIAIDYLRKNGINDFDHDVAMIDKRYPDIIMLCFKKNKNVMPPFISLIVRKSDGCVSIIPDK